MALWKEGRLVADPWLMLADDAPAPADAPVLVSLARWRAEGGVLTGRGAAVGVVIAPGSDWEAAAAGLTGLAVIAVTIAKFGDGRAFSIARLLRDRYGYSGEIRAVGSFVIDQMPLMRRTGIDAFAIEDPILIAQLERGEWPEVRAYLQPAGGAEVPAGTRPWQRRAALPAEGGAR